MKKNKHTKTSVKTIERAKKHNNKNEQKLFSLYLTEMFNELENIFENRNDKVIIDKEIMIKSKPIYIKKIFI